MEKKKEKEKSKLPPPKKALLEEFNLMRTLGTGTFGRVRLAKRGKKGEYVALKIIRKHDVVKRKQVEHVIAEGNIHASLSHPFVVYNIRGKMEQVGFEGVAQDDRYLYMVLEYVQGGDLFGYLRTIGHLSLDKARVYTGMVVLALEHLHNKSIVYRYYNGQHIRDLKPENLLVGFDGYLKLTDFGLSKVIEGKTYTLCGTPEYLAPEMLLNKGHDRSVDWWTLGVLLYELLVGVDPFADDDEVVVYQKILSGKLSFPPDFNRSAKSLIKRLLQSDLSKRIGNLKNGVEDIKKHKFFSSFSWIDCLNKKLPPPHIPSNAYITFLTDLEQQMKQAILKNIPTQQVRVWS